MNRFTLAKPKSPFITSSPMGNAGSTPLIAEQNDPVTRAIIAVDKFATANRERAYKDVSPETRKTIEMAIGSSPMGLSTAVKGSIKAIPKAVNTIKKPSRFNMVSDFLKPVESRIAAQGPAGKQLKNVITKAADVGEVEAGKRVAQLQALKLPKFSRTERFNLLDALEGRATSLSDKVKSAFEVIRKQTDEIGTKAKEIGVKVKEKTTLKPGGEIPTGLTPFQREQLEKGNKVFATIKREFKPRENYFPHVIPNADNLKAGSVRKDIVENLVRQKVRATPAEAGKFLDEYVEFLDTGKRQDSLIEYMVKTGQATDDAEAFANLQRFRTRTIKRQGSLEFARQVDLPFYDPDPVRVIPNFVTEQSKRLSQIERFGQDDQVINKLIKQIRDQGDDADFTRSAVDRILGKINDRPANLKVSSLLRTIQGFKLGLAAIPNVTQGPLNSLLAGDFPSLARGLKGAFTKGGRQFALKSGATLDSILQETARESGSASKALGTFLKATGFSATEKFNRTLAANTGRAYVEKLFKQKTPDALRRLSELGLDDVAKKLALSDDDVLIAAKKFSDLTQFRSRPQDLPFFAATPTGKVFFQFKNFIYGQSRLLLRSTVGELKQGKLGRATRNLMILGSVFPLAGEVVADIRSLVTGKERKEKGLDRYFDNIARTGALGMLMDTLQSGKYNRGTESIVGPTVSDLGELINIAGKGNKVQNLTKFGIRRIPLIGQVISNRLYPSGTKKKTPTGNRFNQSDASNLSAEGTKAEKLKRSRLEYFMKSNLPKQQYTREQMRVIKYSEIDMNPGLTEKQKKELKAKLQFDDLPTSFVQFN